jgi:hypothetical protein
VVGWSFHNLLNQGTEISSDSFKYFSANYMKNYFIHRLHNMGPSDSPVERTDDQPADNTIQPQPCLVLDEEEPPCAGTGDFYREGEDDSDDDVESHCGDVADDEYHETNVFDMA